MQQVIDAAGAIMRIRLAPPYRRQLGTRQSMAPFASHTVSKLFRRDGSGRATTRNLTYFFFLMSLRRLLALVFVAGFLAVFRDVLWAPFPAEPTEPDPPGGFALLRAFVLAGGFAARVFFALDFLTLDFLELDFLARVFLAVSGLLPRGTTSGACVSCAT